MSHRTVAFLHVRLRIHVRLLRYCTAVVARTLAGIGAAEQGVGAASFSKAGEKIEREISMGCHPATPSLSQYPITPREQLTEHLNQSLNVPQIPRSILVLKMSRHKNPTINLSTMYPSLSINTALSLGQANKHGRRQRLLLLCNTVAFRTP